MGPLLRTSRRVIDSGQPDFVLDEAVHDLAHGGVTPISHQNHLPVITKRVNAIDGLGKSLCNIPSFIHGRQGKNANALVTFKSGSHR
ncbi:MAG: hypothetical protein ACE1ZE_03370 [Candidatus Binatia bacterium]